MAKKRRKLKKKIRRKVVNLLALGPVSRGFTGGDAKRWVRKVYRHKVRDYGFTKQETNWAIDHGYMPEQVAALGINASNVNENISYRDYTYLRPINGTYSKWITDRVTVDTIFKPFRPYMPKIYYQISKRYKDTMIIPLYDLNAGDTLDDVLELIKEKGELTIAPANGISASTLSWHDDAFWYDSRMMEPELLKKRLCRFRATIVIMEKVRTSDIVDHGVLNLVVFNEEGDNPVIGDGSFVYNAYQTKKLRPKKRKRRKTAVPVPGVEEEELEDVMDDTLDETDAEEEDDEIDAEDIDAEDIDAEDIQTADVDADKLVEEDIVSATEDDSRESGAEDEEEAELEAVEEEAEDAAEEEVEVVEKPKRYEKNVDVKTGTWEDGRAIPYWDEIQKVIHDLCVFAPQLEFFGVQIVINENGFKITKMRNHPKYPKLQPFSPETTAYLKRKVEQKKAAFADHETRRERAKKKVKLRRRTRFAKKYYPKGLVPYLSYKWIGDLWKDFRTNKDTTLKQKIWAYKHGFLSYRLLQYGITEDNWENFISDFEYKWLRHINPKYRKWMEDKITVKYICSEYNEYFPAYYYHIICKNGNNKVISMMDLPEGYTNTFEDIFRLVEEKKVLALKPDEGSHGDGFYKFAVENGKYQLNHKDVEKEDVLKILEDVNNQYLVTEYINMHEEIKRIYAGAVNTIRMIVFKKDGKNPVIGNAYMRFGSKKTGAVDNMGAGGMFAKIDIETGRFYDSKIITNNSIETCLYHPDTGVKIDGYLPNWEKVKADVLAVARSIPQLEYFGFDLAITEDGLKFPEINRFPDYPAIEKYTPETIDYLLYKLECKKRLYGYHRKPNTTLFHLPQRTVVEPEIPEDTELAEEISAEAEQEQ